jgi:hypothetical protein
MKLESFERAKLITRVIDIVDSNGTISTNDVVLLARLRNLVIKLLNIAKFDLY